MENGDIVHHKENGHHHTEADQRSDSYNSFIWESSCSEDQTSGHTDLILAAKLGKSLLEQNEELSAEYYKIVRKLEVRFNIIMWQNSIAAQ